MKRRSHLGWPFWVYCVLALVVGFAAMNTGHNLLFWVFGAMASALFASGIVSGLMMMRLSVRRYIPMQGVVGEPLVVRYAVHNANRFCPVFNIFCEEAAGPAASGGGTRRPDRAWIMHIGPSEEVHGDAVLETQRRGEIRFEAVRIWSTFPFGIVRKSVTIEQPQHALIHPRVYRLRERVLDAIAPAGALGMNVSAHAGAGDDYFGLRDFRPSDSLRNVSWKRTANRDALVCIERARPAPPRLRVILDLTGRGERGGDVSVEERREREERAISLAASFVHAADRRGLEIGLEILGFGDLPIPVRRTHWHRGKLMAALARIDLEERRRPDDRPRAVVRDDAASVVVHPDRPVPAIGPESAWHFTAGQLEHLVEPGPAPRGTPGPDRERAA